MFIDSMAIDYFLNDAVLVNINAEEDTAIANQYSVSGYPTCVLTDKNGEEIDRFVGYAPTEEFIGTLQNYSKGIGTLADLLSKAETSEDRAMFYEIAEKYKYRGGSEEAVQWFQKVIDAGEPNDSVSGDSRLSIADLYRRAKDYDKAYDEYTAIEKDFEGMMHGMDAVIYQAIVLRSKGDTTAAIEKFTSYIDRFPESPDVDYAQKQIEKLRNPKTGS